MNKSVTLLLIFVFLTASSIIIIQPVKAESQPPQLQWSKTYGPYNGLSVVQTSDGGYAIATENATYRPFQPHSPGDWENFTAVLDKTDELGNIKWSKTYGAFQGPTSFGLTVVQTNDLGYALGSKDGWLLKLDSEGNVQWKVTFDSSIRPYHFIQGRDGSYFLAVGMIIKIDENGKQLWNRTYGNAGAGSIIEGNDGGYVIAGSLEGHGWLAEIDGNGSLLWNQTSLSELQFYSIVKTSDGGYILIGTVDTSLNGVTDLVKVNSEGVTQWTHTYENPSYADFSLLSVAQLADGRFVAAGTSAFIMTDALGNVQWQANYVDVGSGNAISVIATNDGGFAVTGQLYFAESNQDIVLAKFVLESGVSSPSPAVTAIATPTLSPNPSISQTPLPSIPEFPSWIILPVFLIITTLVAAVVIKRKSVVRL